jgi:fructose-bisphosphate aldolase class II
MALTGQIRRVLIEHPDEFDPRNYLKPAMRRWPNQSKLRLQEFGTAGKASKIKKIIPLAEMAEHYASGEPDPKFG